MSEPAIKLDEAELLALTGFKWPTKQLNVLHARGFLRAYIGREGVVLERSHYEAVTRGELHHPTHAGGKVANLSFLHRA